MLYDAKENEEEVSPAHEGESSSLESLESSEDDDEYDNETIVEDINGNSGGDKNINAGGGSAEWLRFIIPRVQTEALDAMTKAKESSSTASKKTKLEKVRIN